MAPFRHRQKDIAPPPSRHPAAPRALNSPAGATGVSGVSFSSRNTYLPRVRCRIHRTAGRGGRQRAGGGGGARLPQTDIFGRAGQTAGRWTRSATAPSLCLSTFFVKLFHVAPHHVTAISISACQPHHHRPRHPLSLHAFILSLRLVPHV